MLRKLLKVNENRDKDCADEQWYLTKLEVKL